MIHTGSCTGLQLSIIPEHNREWLTRQLDKEDAFFEGHAGNALLVPTRSLPFAYRDEYSTVMGTCVEAYTPILDVFFWQFARVWMGLPEEGKAYIAAPKEHVRGALDDEIYLVHRPEEILRAFPDDCNLHWRSFSSAKQDPEAPFHSPFAELLRFLQITGVVLPDTEADDRLIAFCQRWSIPLTPRTGSVPCTSQSATTFLWLLPQANEQWVARLGTIFACWYGIDLDD